MPSSSTTSSATASSSASCCKIAQKCQLLDLVPLLMTMPVKPFDSKGGWHWQMLHVHHYHRRPHHHQIGMLSFKKVGEFGKFSQRGRRERSSKSHHFMSICKVFFCIPKSNAIWYSKQFWALNIMFDILAECIGNQQWAISCIEQLFWYSGWNPADAVTCCFRLQSMTPFAAQ